MKVVLIEDVAPGQEVRFWDDTRGWADVENRYLRRISTSRFHGTSDGKSCASGTTLTASARSAQHTGTRWTPGGVPTTPDVFTQGSSGCQVRLWFSRESISLTVHLDLSGDANERRISCAACGKTETVSVTRLRPLVELAERIIRSDGRGTLGTPVPPSSHSG